MLIRKTFLSRFWFALSQFDKSKDYYKILGVTRTASTAEIKKAFYALAKKSHPDANKGSDNRFKQYNEAFNVLSKPDLKKEYDEATSPSAAGPSAQSSAYSNPNPGYQRSSTYTSGFSSGYSSYNANSYRTQSQNPRQSAYQNPNRNNASDRRRYYQQDDQQPQSLWKDKNYQRQFTQQMFRAQQKARQQQRRSSSAPRNDGHDFRSYVNSRAKYDDTPPGSARYGHWQSNDPQFVKNYMDDFMKNVKNNQEFYRKVQEEEERVRKQEYEDALKRRQQFEKTVGDVLHKGEEFLKNPKDKIAEAGKKVWDWIKKK